jgi:hypothetical protein
MSIAQPKFESEVALHSWNSNVRGTSDALFGMEVALKNSMRHRRSSFEKNSVYSHQKASLRPSRLQGKYTGVAFGVGVPDNLKIRLKYTGGSRFTGQAEARNSSDSRLFSNTSLSGRVVDGALLLTQTGVINANLPPGSTPCLRGGRLKIRISRSEVTLRGSWTSDNSDCGFSRIRLRKQ